MWKILNSLHWLQQLAIALSKMKKIIAFSSVDFGEIFPEIIKAAIFIIEPLNPEYQYQEFFQWKAGKKNIAWYTNHAVF